MRIQSQSKDGKENEWLVIRSSSSPSLAQRGQNLYNSVLFRFNYISTTAIMPRIGVSLQCLTWHFMVALLIMLSSATVFLLPCIMADGSSSSSATAQIVYTEKPVGNEEATHLHTLANVLGRSLSFSNIFLILKLWVLISFR